MFKNQYKYYKVMFESKFNGSLYRKGDIIRIGTGPSFKYWSEIVVIYSPFLNDKKRNINRSITISVDNLKSFIDKRSTTNNKRMLIALVESNNEISTEEYKIAINDKKLLNANRLDYTDELKGYERACSIMKEAINNVQGYKRYSVYDDDTIGNKDTWSDCGFCSKYKNLDTIRRDVSMYPCPFNSSMYSEDSIKKIKEINNSKKRKEYDCEWWGCYHKCLLRGGLEKKEAIETIDRALKIVKTNK